MSKKTGPNVTFRRNAGSSAEILLYSEIGSSGWFYGITSQDFIQQLNDLGPVGAIDLRINSPGGDIAEGMAIYNALCRHSATITTHIDSLAASIASVIAMAGDTIKMADNALMMIHDPYSGIFGTEEDLRREADVLSKLRDSIAGVYADRTGVSVDTFKAHMAAETWYNATEAFDTKLCTEIVSNKTDSRENLASRFDLSRFKKIPENLKRTNETQTIDWKEAHARREQLLSYALQE